MTYRGKKPFFSADGRQRSGSRGESSSLLNNLTDAEIRKMTATGGEFVLGLVNSIIWEFSGPDLVTARNLLDFSLVQPLLRFGGRARVLKGLTLSERNLLANVRQLAQFQRGFVVDITTGRNSGEGPNRRGSVGASGLGLLAGNPSGRTGAPPAGGFLGLLQEQRQIRSQETNVTALRNSIEAETAVKDAELALKE